MSNCVVWVDIPVTNLERAIAFYAAVLGRPVTKEGGPGFVFGLFSHSGEDVGGCVYVADKDNSPSSNGPLIYLNAAGRLPQAVQVATSHGGSVLQAIHQIGPHGSRAVVLDSEGNRIALHAPSA
jgi:uncharacterized protein